MLYLGLDVSSSYTGWAVYDTTANTVIASGCWKLSKHKEPHVKMTVLFNNLTDLLEHFHITTCVIESPIFYVGRMSSARSVAVCHSFWAIARLVLALKNVDCVEQSPMTTRSIFGIKRDEKGKQCIHDKIRDILPATIMVSQEDELDAIGLVLSLTLTQGVNHEEGSKNRPRKTSKEKRSKGRGKGRSANSD